MTDLIFTMSQQKYIIRAVPEIDSPEGVKVGGGRKTNIHRKFSY